MTASVPLTQPPPVLSRDAFVGRLGAAVGRSTHPLNPDMELGRQGFGSLDLAVAGRSLPPLASTEVSLGHWTPAAMYQEYVLAMFDGAVRRWPDSGRAAIRPFVGGDHDFVIEELCRRLTHPWLDGRTPSPGGWSEILWREVTSMVTVFDRVDGRPLGVIRLTQVDERDGHGQLSTVFSSDAWELGWPLAGLWSFVDHVFTTWPLEAIYAEIPGLLVDAWGGSLHRFADCCGVLREHRRSSRGMPTDVAVYRIGRLQWESNARARIDWAIPGV